MFRWFRGSFLLATRTHSLPSRAARTRSHKYAGLVPVRASQFAARISPTAAPLAWRLALLCVLPSSARARAFWDPQDCVWPKGKSATFCTAFARTRNGRGRGPIVQKRYLQLYALEKQAYQGRVGPAPHATALPPHARTSGETAGVRHAARFHEQPRGSARGPEERGPRQIQIEHMQRPTPSPRKMTSAMLFAPSVRPWWVRVCAQGVLSARRGLHTDRW